MTQPNRRLLHWMFEASVLLKGIFAAIETAFGLVLLTPLSLRARDVLEVSGLHRLISDPDDHFARFLTLHLSAVDQRMLHFWAIYLLGHGLTKLCVVLALIRKWYHAYPLAMLVLAGFIIWQMRDWWHSGSMAMIALSLFDAVVIWLTWKEWRGQSNPPAA